MIGIRIAREERKKGAIAGSHVLKPGTLIYIDNNIAQVRWDADDVEEFDLRVSAEETDFGSFFLLDNAPAGVVHQECVCHSCEDFPLPGVRWQCPKGYDLCSKCYMDDAPSLNHSFHRMLTPSSCGYDVGKRAGCEAMEIADTQSKVFYYKDHLAQLKEILELRSDSSDLLGIREIPVLRSDSSDLQGIREGDKVCILLSEELLNDSLVSAPEQSKTHINKVFGRFGVVEKITDSQELVVDYKGFKCQWPHFIFSKVPTFSVGDSAFVMEDEATIKKLSDGHGAWKESMKQILGKECKVLLIDDDGDVQVTFNEKIFLVNPFCLSKKEQAKTNGQGISYNDAVPVMDDIDRQLLKTSQTKSKTEDDDLVKAAFQPGQLGSVLENIRGDLPVNHQLNGHTALHVAANLSYLEDVEQLLVCGADGSIKDPNGYSTLHIAARKDETGAIARKLLEHGCLPGQNDNEDGVSPLHLAVANQKVKTLKVLLQQSNSADINVQNRCGETPLHIAVKNLMDSNILDILLRHKGIDCSLSDNTGNNPLQLAALLGNERAVRNILQRVPELLTRSKENGFSPLHLAAYGNNVGVAEILVNEKNCDVNATTNERFTALHLAGCQGYLPMMSYLMKSGARTDLQDVDGDTALTMVLLQQAPSTNSWKAYSAETRSSPELCKYCEKKPPQAFFKPCGHKIACSDCAKKRTTAECKECKRAIRRSVYPDN